MPKISIDVPHNLGQAEALNRIQSMIGKMKQQYGDQVTDLQESWNGPVGQFSGKAMGFNLKGSIQVNDRDVKINGDLPLMASPFKGRIEEMVQKEAAELLA